MLRRFSNDLMEGLRHGVPPSSNASSQSTSIPSQRYERSGDIQTIRIDEPEITTWEKGMPYRITWSCEGVQSVNIFLVQSPKRPKVPASETDPPAMHDSLPEDSKEGANHEESCRGPLEDDAETYGLELAPDEAACLEEDEAEDVTLPADHVCMNEEIEIALDDDSAIKGVEAPEPTSEGLAQNNGAAGRRAKTWMGMLGKVAARTAGTLRGTVTGTMRALHKVPVARQVNCQPGSNQVEWVVPFNLRSGNYRLLLVSLQDPVYSSADQALEFVAAGSVVEAWLPGIHIVDGSKDSRERVCQVHQQQTLRCASEAEQAYKWELPLFGLAAFASHAYCSAADDPCCYPSLASYIFENRQVDAVEQVEAFAKCFRLEAQHLGSRKMVRGLRIKVYQEYSSRGRTTKGMVSGTRKEPLTVVAIKGTNKFQVADLWQNANIVLFGEAKAYVEEAVKVVLYEMEVRELIRAPHSVYVVGHSLGAQQRAPAQPAVRGVQTGGHIAAEVGRRISGIHSVAFCLPYLAAPRSQYPGLTVVNVVGDPVTLGFNNRGVGDIVLSYPPTYRGMHLHNHRLAARQLCLFSRENIAASREQFRGGCPAPELPPPEALDRSPPNREMSGSQSASDRQPDRRWVTERLVAAAAAWANGDTESTAPRWVALDADLGLATSLARAVLSAHREAHVVGPMGLQSKMWAVEQRFAARVHECHDLTPRPGSRVQDLPSGEGPPHARLLSEAEELDVLVVCEGHWRAQLPELLQRLRRDGALIFDGRTPLPGCGDGAVKVNASCESEARSQVEEWLLESQEELLELAAQFGMRILSYENAILNGSSAYDTSCSGHDGNTSRQLLHAVRSKHHREGPGNHA
ncbi:hypothetical protein CYMTET_14060 [Cymbomonas tetramitiformis]|uniref:Uncharacterized protein n=1 Tax=Cymbomonas tetramitiformis TaxID=36881 RepID=A0AAE0GH70_9CHLO|nr:hypothetical protein CYMTET_14060 [Cymbomonas tetramitiformis]